MTVTRKDVQRAMEKAVENAGGKKIRIGPDRGKWSGRKAVRKLAAERKKAAQE